MPKCPQCGKESANLYITSSGVCAECNRKNYKAKEAGEEVNPPQKLYLPFPDAYKNMVSSAGILANSQCDIESLSEDELSKLVQLHAAQSLGKIYKLLFAILVVVPLALFFVSIFF